MKNLCYINYNKPVTQKSRRNGKLTESGASGVSAAVLRYAEWTAEGGEKCFQQSNARRLIRPLSGTYVIAYGRVGAF